MDKIYQPSLLGNHEPARRFAKKGYGTFESLNNYEAFVEKFKPKKTTDDCFTPPQVYDAVLGWVRSQGLISDKTEVVRPFYPNMDYRQVVYPEDCAVIDNPPFSIYAQIVRWYMANDIKFFLFGPHLTLLVHDADVCYLPVNAQIIYENGAKVSTGFVTNMIPNVRLWTAPELYRAIRKVQPAPSILPKNSYPPHVITTSLIGKISTREVDFKVMSDECCYIRNLTTLRNEGKSLFGRGLLLSSRAAAERAAAERAAAERAAAERAAAERAAAERAAGTTVVLSECELEIIKNLDKTK